MIDFMNIRQQLRKQIRQRRNDLSLPQQYSASVNIHQCLTSQSKVKHSQHIAIYLANDGELDLNLFIDWCWQQNKKVYLPVIHPFSKGHLLFLRYKKYTPMIKNQYGIFEPQLNVTNVIPVSQLELIFTPLVSFDNLGNRLGMGGGFYDRTLAFWYKNTTKSINTLSPIGIAHDCQKVDSIPNESWDIPMPEIITPSKHFKFY